MFDWLRLNPEILKPKIALIFLCNSNSSPIYNPKSCAFNKVPFLNLDKSLNEANVDSTEKAWFDLAMLISTYFVFRFQYNGDNRLIINDIYPNLIQSQR